MCRFMFPNFNFNIERWKWNDEYRVYVSTAGRCKDEHKRLLPVKINSSGYCMVKTVCGHRLVHRLVMKTWRPIPDDENLTVDHLDHNKRNNDVRNLEWVTEAENKRRAKQDLINEKKKENKSPQNKLDNLAATKKVTNGSDTYNTALEAAEVIIKKQNPRQGQPSKKAIEKAGRRIIAAIQFGKRYLGYNWLFAEPVEE